MPIYEYICGTCEKSFEHLQRTMADGPKPPCPECGSTQTSRQLSVFAVAGGPSKNSGVLQAQPGMCQRCGEAPGSCGS